MPDLIELFGRGFMVGSGCITPRGPNGLHQQRGEITIAS